MSAPASVHTDTRGALLEIYQILRGAALRARESRAPGQSAAKSDPEGVAAPTGSGEEGQ
jgi:hypothetical protein